MAEPHIHYQRPRRRARRRQGVVPTLALPVSPPALSLEQQEAAIRAELQSMFPEAP